MKRKQQIFEKDVTKKWTNVLTIDPGLRGMGFAMWPELVSRQRSKKAIPPALSGVVTNPKKIPREECVAKNCAWITSFMDVHKIEHVVFEYPEHWANSAVSHGSTERGDLFILAYLIGGMADRVRQHCVLGPILVSPREWKGQLSKEAVVNRVRLAINKKYKDHETDAVGIGLAIQGVL